MYKDSQSLNGEWLFTYDPNNVGGKLGFIKPDFNRDKWKTVIIPSFWDDARYDGIGWYAKSFTLNTNLKNKKLAVIFESVDDNAEIFLNGEKIYKHTGYGLQFNVIVTDKVKADEENLLVVKVEDTGGSGGINGNVYLLPFTNENELLKTKYYNFEALTIPKWVRNTTIYELYVRAYSEEGNFNNVTSDLPRLKEMGIGCIWLMPVFPIGEERRKGTLGSPYAIADYKAVNPKYGTIEDFQQLVNEAHKLGIKVILDIACNHSAWDNPLIQEHLEWYNCNDKGEIISPNDAWTDVADFNYDNNELREYMWGILEFWVENYDIDGYRIDVAELVPDDFWKVAYSRLKEIKPDILMLAEGDHPRLYLNGFHLTYAWNTRSSIHSIIKRGKPATNLFEVLEKEHYRYPKNSTHMRFTENHDLRRAADLIGIEESKVAAFLSFTLPGVPMIYAGQEIGAVEKPSLFEKSVINWENGDYQLVEFYKKLIELRLNNPELCDAEFIKVANSDERSIISFARIVKEKAFLVVANTREKERNTSFDIENLTENYGNNLKLIVGNVDYSTSNLEIFFECQPLGCYLFEISN
jgi:glycosidase